MKKIFFISVLFLGVCLLSGQELKVDGSFKNVNAKTNLPGRWSRNGAGMKDAVIKVIPGEKSNILKITSKGKYVAFYSSERMKAAPGSVYEYSVKIKGTANYFTIGFYAYSGKNQFVANDGVSFNVNSPDKFTEYKGNFTFTKKADAQFMRVQFGSSRPMDVEICDLKIIPAAGKTAVKSDVKK